MFIKRPPHIFLIPALALALLAACTEKPTGELDALKNWPQMDYPEDNLPDAAKIALGEQLFEDPILSIDSSISCASCHKTDFALADNLPISPGVQGRLGKRNSPSLFNIGYHPYFMREGGVPTLEMQVLVPVQEHAEMDFNIVLLAERLNQNPTYKAAFMAAYGDSATPYTITRSLAQFERTLIAHEAPVDAYANGDDSVLSSSALRGLNLFFGKASCNTCHSGPLFTDHSFHNNGTAITDGDYGRGDLTLDSADFYTFKVPPLRFVSQTAPYMHAGTLATLDDVLAQYNAGGTGHAYQSDLIAPLNLSESELVDLKAFLETL